MFERYTEKARRVIFFARYEASQFGSSYIETEHLLLGWLREEPHNSRLVPAQKRGQVKEELESYWVRRRKISESEDLPLTNECKRALAYAAEEAARVGHQHIGTEHLLLGILRESECIAARILNKHDVTLEQVRAVVRQLPSVVVSTTPASAPNSTVTIHGSTWDASYVQNMVEDLRRYYWDKRDWKARDLLVEKSTGKIMFSTAESFDVERFELRKGGWPLDHCAICRWELKEDSDASHSVAYTNGHEWICSECHDRLIAGKGEEPSQT